MATLKSEKNRGYLIAGIGAFVALFAFLYLPFIAFSESVTYSTDASNTVSYSSLATTTEIAQLQGAIWLEGILALAILVLACLLLFRTNPFGSSRTPVVNQFRWGIYGLGGGAILCILVQFLVSLDLGSTLQQNLHQVQSTIGGVISASTIYGLGSWLYLLGMVAVIVGSVMAYRSSGFVASMPGASTYNAQTPSMPYAVPGSSPYDSSYPPSAPQGSVPPYQQNVQPSSPYDAQSPAASWQQQNTGTPPQYQVPNQQPPQYQAPNQQPPQYQVPGQQPPQYQVPNQQSPQGPPQQWPPSYPSQ